MNKIHDSLLTYLKGTMESDPGNTVAKIVVGKTDEQVIRMMFSNFRGRETGARGLRLTNLGMQVMKTFFQGYEIERDGKKLGPMELVYLDKKARLPYHIGNKGDLVMFDPELGIKLKLADGDVSILMEMDAILED